jgi:hypothetical protein
MQKYQTVVVDQTAIDYGAVRDCQKCPIARAVERTMPQWYGLQANGVGCAVFDDYLIIEGTPIPLPRSAQRFIARFDQGKPVKPFAFKVPTEAILNAIQ